MKIQFPTLNLPSPTNKALAIIDGKDPTDTTIQAYDTARRLCEIGLTREITKNPRVENFLITGLRSSTLTLRGLYAVPLLRSQSAAAYDALEGCFRTDKDVKDCNPFTSVDGVAIFLSKLGDGFSGLVTGDSYWRRAQHTFCNKDAPLEKRIEAASVLLLYGKDILCQSPRGNIIGTSLAYGSASFPHLYPQKLRARARLVFLFFDENREAPKISLAGFSFRPCRPKSVGS